MGKQGGGIWETRNTYLTLPLLSSPGHPLALFTPTRSCWLIPPLGLLSVPSPEPLPKLTARLCLDGRSTLLNRAACLAINKRKCQSCMGKQCVRIWETRGTYQYPPALVTSASPWSLPTLVSGPDRESPKRVGMS